MSLVRLVLGAAIALNSLGCASGTTPGADLKSSKLPLQLGSGLVQSVVLSSDTVSSGDILRIHSVIRNAGSATVSLESRICGLVLGGDLGLAAPPGIGMCQGYSMRRALSPGDSVVSDDIRQVTSSRGTYRLEVKHALNPAATAQLGIVVR